MALTANLLSSLDSALEEATRRWKEDLENLFHDSKSRFADVVWEVLEDPEERLGGVWRTKQVVKKRSRDLRSLLGFSKDPTSTGIERYREVWGHKAMVYARASPGFHLRHFYQTNGTPIQSEPNSPLSPQSAPPRLQGFEKEGNTSRHTTPFRHTVFVQELLDIYTGHGGLDDFGSLKLDYDNERADQDWRTNQLRQDLRSMWETRLYSDCRIEITLERQSPINEDETIEDTVVYHAHRFILVSRSLYFNSVLSTTSQKNGEISHHSPLLITLPYPVFTQTSFDLILEFIYTGTLPLPLPDISSNIFVAFSIWHGALYLGIPFLLKLMECQILIMLHGLCFPRLNSDEYQRLVGDTWTRMITSGGCQCAQCRRRLPRALAFAMTSGIKGNHLERGALRGLIKLFGLGWCTPQFAALSQELKDYILLVLRFTVMTPVNALALLFAAEESLNKMDDPTSPAPPWLMPIKTLIISVRDSIDVILCEETSKCLESNEWDTIRKNDALEVDLGVTSTANPRKLAAIHKAILRAVGPEEAVRVYQAINIYTKEPAAKSWKGVHTPENSVLQAHLHRIKTELRNKIDIIPDDLDDIPSSDDGSSTNRSSLNSFRPTSTIYSALSTISRPLSMAEIQDTARQPSIDALDLASISKYSNASSRTSLRYSHASSRTASTDYGLFYTRRAYSEESLNTVMAQSGGEEPEREFGIGEGRA